MCLHLWSVGKEMQSPQYDLTPWWLTLISTQCITIMYSTMWSILASSVGFCRFFIFFHQFIIVLGRQLEVVQLDWIKILEKKYSFLKLFQGIFVEFYENSDAVILTGKPARHQLYTKKTKKVLVVILWCFFLILIYYANNPYTFQ